MAAEDSFLGRSYGFKVSRLPHNEIILLIVSFFVCVCVERKKKKRKKEGKSEIKTWDGSMPLNDEEEFD